MATDGGGRVASHTRGTDRKTDVGCDAEGKKQETRIRCTSRKVPQWTEDCASGVVASLATKLVLQPFDTAKTVMQAAEGARYRTLGDCVVRLAQAQGVGTLYRGLPAAIAASAPSSAVFFATYESLKRRLGATCAANTLLAACGANLAASLLRVPPEVVKQRVQTGLHRHALDALLSIAREDGVRGFYRGYGAQLMRDIPYAMAQFGTYEALKRRADGSSEPSTSSHVPTKGRTRRTGRRALQALGRGACAGAVACVITTPMDVVKTRMMTARGKLVRGHGTWWSTATHVWRESGPKGFMRGVTPRLLYKMPSSAIFLVAYEIASRCIRKWNETERPRASQRPSRTTHAACTS
mmetsp:Transcript_9287/g.56544  ORF Transcript_9287/g.56544 Transcript_9287/m.56544 type:complete len:353 (+) Transcript_9287:52-1110(+)